MRNRNGADGRAVDPVGDLKPQGRGMDRPDFHDAMRTSIDLPTSIGHRDHTGLCAGALESAIFGAACVPEREKLRPRGSDSRPGTRRARSARRADLQPRGSWPPASRRWGRPRQPPTGIDDQIADHARFIVEIEILDMTDDTVSRIDRIPLHLLRIAQRGANLRLGSKNFEPTMSVRLSASAHTEQNGILRARRHAPAHLRALAHRPARTAVLH